MVGHSDNTPYIESTTAPPTLVQSRYMKDSVCLWQLYHGISQDSTASKHAVQPHNGGQDSFSPSGDACAQRAAYWALLIWSSRLLPQAPQSTIGTTNMISMPELRYQSIGLPILEHKPWRYWC